MKYVLELELMVLYLWYDKMGVEYFYIVWDDSNNVFLIGFKINLLDDIGVLYILEYIMFCGSEKCVVGYFI